ncbi:MAG: 2-oxo acid dehydrogenase subunit E2, partial [Pseudobdellovibrionaceae bacterium]
HSNIPQQPQAAAAMVMKPATTSASTTSNTNGLSTYTDSIYPPVADSRVLATPATRRYAREMNVDINQIQGTGLAGRVTQEDVLKAKSGSATSQVGKPSSTLIQIPKPGYQSNNQAMEERVALRGVRKKIAENLQMSKAIIPHFTLMDEANVTDLVALRGSLKEAAEKAKTKITYLPFVIKALIATMREFPTFNASIDDVQSEIVYKKYFNIGFAADTPNGLLVPVIKNADHKSILEISKEIIDLSTRARDGKLKPDEMKGATITITNIGSVGGTYATPIINHPEVAILGMYKIQEKPVIKNGQLAAIQVMNYTVTCDHRLIDGAVAANFLKAFIQRLENPGRLMLDMM